MPTPFCFCARCRTLRAKMRRCGDRPRTPRHTAPCSIVGIDDASSGPTTLRATLSRSSPWDTPRMSAILGADEHGPFAFPIGICGSQGLAPPPETSAHPSGFSLRSQQDFPGFNPQTINGSLSYPRCHGVQFRRTSAVYHIRLSLCGKSWRGVSDTSRQLDGCWRDDVRPPDALLLVRDENLAANCPLLAAHYQTCQRYKRLVQDNPPDYAPAA